MIDAPAHQLTSDRIGEHPLLTDAPRVSVIVPAYNAERTIAAALQSVLDGAFLDFEIIVCDDASTDATVAVVETIEDQRIRLIKNERNLGAGGARDRAIVAARGHWILLLDADDQLISDALDSLLAIAADHPNAIVFGQMLECHDTQDGLQPWKAIHQSKRFPGDVRMARRIAIEDWLLQPRTVIQPLIPASLIHRSSARHSKKQFGEDLGFLLQLVASRDAELWYVPRLTYLYRINPVSASTSPGRYHAFVETLRDAIPLFAAHPSMLAAIQAKLADAERAERYFFFFCSISGHRWCDAVRYAAHEPWVLIEFVRRSLSRLPYHISRIVHGGRKRPTS